MKTILKAEKMDILLVLARAFEKKFSELAEANGDAITSTRPADKYFGAMSREDFEVLNSRAAFLGSLSEESLVVWQEIQLDKLRRRGRATFLNENINPSHLAEAISREPKAIQNLILKNLPLDVSERIVKYLQVYFSIENINFLQEKSEKNIKSEIVGLVKRKFLANFVALEDVYEPNSVDVLSISEIENFIHHLGLYEVATACRGIDSKEALAAFLNRFDEKEARDIARYITELEKINPFWVEQADDLVRRSWRGDFPPEKILKKIGFKLLAIAFTERTEKARHYTSQKLSAHDAENWLKMVRRSEEKFLKMDEKERLNVLKRQRSIERRAAKFVQTGRL